MSVIDELNKLADESYGDLQAKGEAELNRQQHQGYNPFDDMGAAISEWVDTLEQHGQKIAKAAGEAYSNIPNEAWDSGIDDIGFDNPMMSAANQKLADALQDAVEDARYDATRDPLILGANVATAVTGNPWALPFVQAFDIAHQVAKAESTEEGTGAKVAGENALMLGLGVAAGGLSHGIGNTLKDYAPKLAQAMTTPLAGSMAGATAVMAYDPQQREFAKEHPARAAYIFFGTDAALGVHAAVKGGNWSAKTNPVTDAEVITDKTNPATATPTETSTVITPASIVDSPTPASPVKRRGKKAYKRRKAERAAREKQGVTTDETMSNRVATAEEVETPIEMSVTETYEGMAEPRLKARKPETAAEEAFPENKPENRIIEEQTEARFNAEHEEARRLPETMQGAYGDKLIYSNDRLYPKAVSIEDIWGTVNRMFPARVRHIADEGVGGYFLVKGKGIAARSFRAWSVLAHEVGHGVSDTLKWGQTPEIQKELFNGATSIWTGGQYGNPHMPANYLTYVEEGRAAFMNEYLVNPEMAKKHFPLAFAELEAVLPTNIKLANGLDVLGQQVRRWGNSTIMEKAAGSIHWADSYGVETIQQGLRRALDKMEKAWSDEFAPLSNISQRFAKDFRDAKLAVEDDLGNVAQRAKEATNTIIRTLFDGNEHRLDTTAAIQALSERFHMALNNVVFTDIFNPLIIGGKRGAAIQQWLKTYKVKDVYEGLSKYLVALRELELIKNKNKQRIDELSSKVKGLEAKRDKAQAAFDAATKDITTPQDVLNKVTQALIKAEKELAEVNNTIDDIIMGKNDYLTTMTRQENLEIVKIAEELPEMKAAANLWRLWNENMLRIAVAGDILPAKSANAFLKNNPNYIPLERSFEIEGFNDAYGFSTIHSLSKEGSDRVIFDPFAQANKNMQAVITKIERNNIAKAAASLADGEYGSYLMMKVNNDVPADKAHQVISVYRNGVKQNYQCIAEGLYDALTTDNKGKALVELNIISGIMQALPRIVRFGATSLPTFGLANCFRDLIDATVLNKDGRRGRLNMRLEPLLLLWDGLTVKLARSQENLNYRNEFYSQGIQYTTNIGSAADITSNIRKLVAPSKWNKIQKGLSAPFRGMEWFNQTLEELPRMGLYKRVRQRQGSKFEAAYVASDGTVNFMRSGTVSTQLNKWTPFFNATLQGTIKTAKAFREDPIGVSLAIAKFVLFPTLLAYYHNQDEDWYRDMPLEKKNKAWYVKAGDTIITIPKPPLIGQIYGSLVERMLDVALMDDEGGAARKELNSIVHSLFPENMPTVALLPVETIANYNFFRGRPIVDSRLGKLKEEEQYTPYTSTVAKFIGQSIGVSPMKVDNAIYDLTSTLGYGINGLIDMAVKDNQTSARKWTEWTRFTYTEGTSSSRSQDVFFNGLDKLEKEYNTTRSKGNSKLKADAKLTGMRKARKAAMDKQKLIRENEANPKLTAEQKRVVRDKLVKEQNDIFRTANKKYLNYKYIQAPK